MHLRSIQPAEKGFEFRTFECGKCDSQQTVTAVADPIQTNKAEWPAGRSAPAAAAWNQAPFRRLFS
jgi:hypothetical protein